MIWKDTYLSIYGPTVDSACQSKNQAMRSKELSIELRDRIVIEAQIWGRVPKNVCSIEGPQETVTSTILKWKKFGTSKTIPRAGHPPKLSNRGGDKEPDGHYDRAPEFLRGDGRTFQKDNQFCSTPPIRHLW